MRLGRACAVLLLALAAALPPAAAEGADKAPAPPLDLKEAVARLAKASSPAEYASILDASSSALPPADSLALLSRGLSSDDFASAGIELRRPLLAKAGDLSLLLGLFGEAASRYESAAAAPGQAPGVPDGPLLLRAARCYLAAGDAEKAARLSADLVAGADRIQSASARLVGAWALVLQDRQADAQAIALATAGDPSLGDKGSAQRCEARFILWLCAAPEAKAAAAAALAAEFPGSPEALISAGAASAPPLPHWYLGGLSGFLPSATLPAAVPSAAPQPAAPSPMPVASAAPSARAKRLQLGYFSLEENAQALKAELAAKRFPASIEASFRAAGSGKTEEKRWIVVVEGGKDIAKTMQSLKDAGYESYVIE